MPDKRMDPRLMACAIAVGYMLVDDLPEPRYNTFHDPGTAAMLSIILANTFSVVGRRGWTGFTHVTFWSAFLLKPFLQSFFWVQHAWVWAIGTLMLAHTALGFVALRNTARRARFQGCFAIAAAVGIAIFLLKQITVVYDSWIGFYAQLGAARVLIPCVFWTVVLSLESKQDVVSP